MGTIEGLTKARMLQIEGNSVVSGAIDPETGHLILEQFDGDLIDAGKARPDTFLDASETNKGVTTLATQAEVDEGTNATEIVTPATLTGKFIQRKATQAEVNTGTDASKYITPATLSGRTATDTRTGLVELATLAEAETGTDTSRVITPEALRAERDKITTYGGVISSSWSSGLAPVLLNPGSPLAGTTVMCLLPFDNAGIKPGSQVIVSRTYTGTWYIVQSYASTPKFMKQIPLTLEPGTGWFMYADPVSQDVFHQYGEGPAGWGGWYAAATNTGAGNPFLTVTSTGIATVSGLLMRGSGGAPPASNTVIARYPIALAPARNQTYIVVAGGAVGNVAVCTDGTIRYLYGANVGYFNLDNLRWRTAASVAAGTATFVALSLNAGFASQNSAGWGGEPGSTVHTPGYTIDAEKVCIMEGIVVSTAGCASGTNISTISGFTAAPGVHMLGGLSGVAFGYLRIGASGGAAGSGNILNTGQALSAGQSLSLANSLWLDTTSPLGRFVPGFMNSWQPYSFPSFAAPAFAKTADGLVMAFGLWGGGTVGPAATYIPPEWRPQYTAIQAAVSNAAMARLDVGLPYAGTPNDAIAISMSSGSNVWYSLDGISWPAWR